MTERVFSNLIYTQHGAWWGRSEERPRSPTHLGFMVDFFLANQNVLLLQYEDGGSTCDGGDLLVESATPLRESDRTPLFSRGTPAASRAPPSWRGKKNRTSAALFRRHGAPNRHWHRESRHFGSRQWITAMELFCSTVRGDPPSLRRWVGSHLKCAKWRRLAPCCLNFCARRAVASGKRHPPFFNSILVGMRAFIQ